MYRLDDQRTPEGFRGRSALVVMIWWAVQQFVFSISPQPAYGFRRWILRVFGANVGKGVLVRPTVRITYPWKVTIGDFSQVGDFVELYSLGAIEIGSNTVISQRSYLCAGTHDFRDQTFPLVSKPIEIGSGCWIAADVFIHPGCKIGDRVIVAARSTVCESIHTTGIYEGNPARFIKSFEERKGII